MYPGNYLLSSSISNYITSFIVELENENRYHDEKKTGEKRPIFESPTKENKSEDSDKEDKNGYISDTVLSADEGWITNNNQYQHDQKFQFTLLEDEIREEDDDDEKEKEKPTTSPSKKKNGKKKKNNNNKKKF
ncbi:hypothetical protein GLOIN_2v1486675 [Rhizophagus irregularis DAOM 181602=DAOM 197198]|nr:hypothetical protein GLOIN_2v1486675 [Rhizophagus irregularis DAOM 181602=DAOM 197198]